MSTEAIDLLRSIDASLKELVAISKARRAANAPPQPVNLNDPKADEKIRFEPREWKQLGGAPIKGLPMSQCPSAALDAYADSCEYFALKNDEKGEKDKNGNPQSMWDRRTAARARAWAQAIRDGKVEAPKPESKAGAWAGSEF
jgi:hypothetical protein